MLVGHSRKLGSKMRTPAVLKAADNVSARELKLYIENDGQLNRQQEVPIQKNLVNKLAILGWHGPMTGPKLEAPMRGRRMRRTRL